MHNKTSAKPHFNKTVLMTLMVCTLSACGSEKTEHIVVTTPPAKVQVTVPPAAPTINHAPIAKISINSQKDNLVRLDAINSSDPDGDSLTNYYWKIVTAPVGSNEVGETFTSVEAPGNIGFLGKVTGSYTIELKVYDGKLWSNAIQQVFNVTVPVTPPAPVYVYSAGSTFSNQSTTIGNAIQLTAPQADSGASSCKLNGKPSGSKATISIVGSNSCQITPDVQGDYQITNKYTLADGKSYYENQYSVRATEYLALEYLPFLPSKSKYNAELGQIVMLDSQASRVQIYDVTTKKITALALPLIGSDLDISPSGHFAVITHDGSASYVNLQTKKVLKTFNTPTRFSGIAMFNDTTAVSVPATSTPSSGVYTPTGYQYAAQIYTLHLTAGSVATTIFLDPSYNNPLAGISLTQNHGVVMSSGNNIYSNTNTVYKLGLDANNQAQISNRINIANSLCSNATLTGNADRFIDNCGHVYRPSINGLMLNLAGNLNSFGNNYSQSISAVDSSVSNNSILATGSFGANGANVVSEFSYDYFDFKRTLLLPVISNSSFGSNQTVIPVNAFYINPLGQHLLIVKSDPYIGTANRYAIARLR